MDRYDIQYILDQSGFNGTDCYGKICLVEAGKILEADKMVAGSVKKIDDKTDYGKDAEYLRHQNAR